MSTHKDVCPGSGPNKGTLTLFGNVRCPVCRAVLPPVERKPPERKP